MRKTNIFLISGLLLFSTHISAENQSNQFLSKRPYQENIQPKAEEKVEITKDKKDQVKKQQQRLNLHFLSKRPYMQTSE